MTSTRHTSSDKKRVLKPDQPRLVLERTLVDNILDGAAFAGLATSWVVLLSTWPELPVSVPHHFGITGEPDAWGPRGMLFILPVAGTVTGAALFGILRIPHLFNYPWPITQANASTHYRRARLLVQMIHLLMQWFFCSIVWETVQIAMQRPAENLWFLTPLFLIAIFSLILGYLIFGNRIPSGQGDSS